MRKHPVRAKTISIKHTTQRELYAGREEYPEQTNHLRPRTRAECEGGLRPCPFVSCRHHLGVDVNERNGSVRVIFPDVDIDEIPETCSLDVADQGGVTLERAAELMNVTRERIRQIEDAAMARLMAEEPELAAFLEEEARLWREVSWETVDRGR